MFMPNRTAFGYMMREKFGLEELMAERRKVRKLERLGLL